MSAKRSPVAPGGSREGEGSGPSGGSRRWARIRRITRGSSMGQYTIKLGHYPVGACTCPTTEHGVYFAGRHGSHQRRIIAREQRPRHGVSRPYAACSRAAGRKSEGLSCRRDLYPADHGMSDTCNSHETASSRVRWQGETSCCICSRSPHPCHRPARLFLLLHWCADSNMRNHNRKPSSSCERPSWVRACHGSLSFSILSSHTSTSISASGDIILLPFLDLSCVFCGK